jgi:hypothetical protein
MNKKTFLVNLISLILLITPTTNSSAQVAAPPPPQAGPLITFVNPSSGEQGQTLELIISGENFQNGARVSFNPAEGIFIIFTQFISTAEMRVNITIASDSPLLSRDVIITNPNQLTIAFKQGFTVVLPADRTPPPPILGLTATDAFDGKVNLSWIRSDTEDFAYYAIYWSENDFADVTDLVPAARISDQATTAYEATGLTDGTKYYFAVTAADQNNNEDKKVLTANATPTPSAVPPVTIPFPTAPIANVTPPPTTPPETEKPTPAGLPTGALPLIIAASFAALAGLTYLIKKYYSKKSLEEKKAEIKKEEKIRFLNKNSKLTKLEIAVGNEKIVDLVKEIINLKLPDFSPAPDGLSINDARKIFETQKDALMRILGGQIPAVGSLTLSYSITIKPVSGIDIECEMAEVSLGGVCPTGKLKIKKQGDNFTYEKNVRVAKTDETWKKYVDDLAPEFVDLKKILQIHLDDLKQQEEKYKNLKR